ncbi:DUF4386 domain-containing protein [Micropruina sp.]|uniref:DUF4386 domain-containing protein n=1 Tax=Micropruina sp. TaxID=2737536 RepID=UPI0039E70670
MGTGVLLWRLLRSHGAVRAATFALLRTVEAAVIIAGTLPMLASVWVDDAHGLWKASASAVHTASFLIGQGLVISVNTIVLGWLLWDSRAVPRTLAALGAIGGTIVLASNLAQLWEAIPLNGVLAGTAAALIFAFEVWLAIYLIAVGLRPFTPDASSQQGRTARRSTNYGGGL